MKLKFFFLGHKEFFLGLVLTLVLLWPLFSTDYFSHHDNVQVIRLYEMDKCFKDGQIPCRWVPDLGMLYGYPLFNYYAPLAYYYGEIFYLLFGSLVVSAKIMFGSAFVASYIFMYLAARKIWGERGGVLAAVFYSYAPYHATLFYVRGAMGELWGLMFFPAILWAILRLAEKISIANVLLVSLFSAGLLLSHNLSSMIFFPLSLAFAITIIRRRAFIVYFLVALLLAVALSAFYLLPALAEKNLVHVETTTYGYFSYTEHFKGLRKLLVDRDWGWGASVREVPGGEKDGMSFQIGWVHLLAWTLTLFSLVKLRGGNHLSKIIIFSSAIILISIFMIHPRSEFVWKLIDPLKYLQFPWRFLGIIIFFISLLAGGALLIFGKRFTTKAWLTWVILLVALNFSYFRPEKFYQTRDQAFLTGEEWDRQLKRSVYDFLPIFAKEPPAALAPSRYEILTGQTKVSDLKEGSDWFSFRVDTSSHTIIRLSWFYFPDWKIKVDGKEVKVDYENHLGLMTIILGEGNHFVEGKLYDTPVRIISNKISFVSGVSVLILILLQVPRIRKGLLYYLRRIG